MWIAEARKTSSKSWRNRDVGWEDFLATMGQRFIRTSETMAAYAKMTKDEQGVIKSLPGGFVGGRLKGRQRTKENVLCRSMITLDADYATAGEGPNGWRRDWDSFACIHDDLASVCYPTHKSTPERPRLRWVFPASREMTPEEYPAVSRRIAQLIGIETLDETCHEINRLFYYPSVPQDAPYELLTQEGKPVDVDAVLSSYGAGEAWKDASLWPISSRELTQTTDAKGKVEDPTTKKGPVGVFCRTYDVESAIAEFLPDIYEETATPGRYTYLAGSTAGGAVVVDGGNGLYSFHSTDPAGGRTRNAFDLVRIHKFGSQDEGKSEDDTPATKLPSYAAMVEWMNEQPEVISQINNERREQWDSDFGDMLTSQDSEEQAGKQPPFIEASANGKLHVDATKLAEWTRKHLNYRLVRDSATDALRVFVYEDGAYRQYAPEMLQGKIKQYVADYNPALVSMRPVLEAHRQIMTDLCYVQQDALDTDEGIINFQNGLLRLSDLTLLPHSPDVLSTIQIPCDWTGAPTPTPVFDGYMETLCNGEAEVKQLLLEIMGVALSNIHAGRMKKALFMVGDGDTGKSQLRLLMEKLLGSRLCSSADLSDLEARFGTSNLYGKRLVGSPDMSFMSVPELRLFKKATAGDPLSVEFKGLNAFSYIYRGVLWFCMNELPRFGGDDGRWVFERILPVRCVNTIPEEMQDKLLLEKLYAERGGIVYQAVQAAKEVVANGYRYDIPEIVIAERRAYQITNNTVLSFIEACMRRTQPSEQPDRYCTTSRVYAVYSAWCKTNSRKGYAKSMPEFRQSLAAYLGLHPDELIVHRNNGSFFRGITLTKEAKSEYANDYACFQDLETRAGETA